jgi:hypothetical protein
MWQQQQKQQKMMWNVAAGYWCGSNSRSSRRLCGMLLQANDVAATAEAAEDDVECRCRLLMWQHQQELQKMIWNVGAGFWCGSNNRRRRRLCGMLLQATDVAATTGGEEDYVDGMLLQG